MRTLKSICLIVALAATPAGAKTFSEAFPGVTYDDAKTADLVKGLDYQQGVVKLPDARATLTVPAGFYYLNAGDARKVLVDGWGNPPSVAEGMLGMLFPSNATPMDPEAWGATISYVAEGYVKDDDAKSLDYNELLSQMQAGTDENNAERTKAGYDPIKLIGWASPPYYDQAQHKLHWAKELKFGTAETNTVNYDVRVLGRNGYLELSFITDVPHLTAVKTVMPDVLAVASFDQGSRYEDFDSSLDKVAEYGIGGLIAGVAVKKLGLLALALVFFKKLWFVAAAVLFGAFGAVKRFFGGRKPEA
ncbi:MAG: DUF2167 domain-containing protein [Hyphomicrobiaceae bacterium]